MAGEAIISLRVEIWQQPEVLQIAEALDLTEFDAVGRLARIWGWAVNHAVDGIAAGLSSRTVDTLVRLPGFAAAMEAVGWLQIADDGLHFPAWDRWLSRTARKRVEAAVRKARSRSKPAQPAPVATPVNRQTSAHAHTPPAAKQTASPPPIAAPASAGPPPAESPPSETPPPRRHSDGTSVFARLTDAALSDGKQLREWYEWQATQPAPVMQVSEQDWLRCVSAAYRSVKHGRRPAAMFASLVGRKLWTNITAEDEEGARSWLRDWGQRNLAQRTPPVPKSVGRIGPPDAQSTGPKQLDRADFIHQLSAVQQQCRRA